MLKSITEKWVDLSTTSCFQFAFYCERCGVQYVSDKIDFIHNFPDDLSEEHKLAKDIIWRTNHQEAFARANLQAAVHFNECNACGKFVCDECYSEDDSELCLACLQKIK